MQLQSPNKNNPHQYDVLSQQSQPDPNTNHSSSSFNSSNQTRYKSFFQLTKIMIYVGLSSFYFGYALAYISAVDFSTIMKIYQISIKQQLAQGLLVSFLPIGGAVGGLLSRFLVTRFSRRQCLLITNFIAFVAGILLFLPNFYTFLFFRFIQGMCAGLFSSFAPLIATEFSPRQISGTLVNFLSVILTFGIFFSFAFSQIIERIFHDPKSEQTWYIVFGFSLIVVVVQTLLICFKYTFQTPKYLFEKLRDQEGRYVVQLFYKQEYVDQVVRQILDDVGRNKQKQNQIIISANLQKSNEQSSTPKAAIIIAISLAAIQQLSGINAVLAYAGQIIADDLPSYKLILPIFINSEQVIAAICTSYILTKVGRKTLFLYGCIGSTLSLLLITFGFWFKSEYHSLGLTSIIVGLIIFMANFGLTLGPVMWVYLPEIVQPSILALAAVTNWGTSSIVMLLFPVIKQRLPEKNPALLFLFFSISCGLSYCFLKKYLIESKNKSSKQLKEQYRQIKIL